MIYKLEMLSLVIIISMSSAFAQKKIRPHLYLYFQVDSIKRIYKTNVKSKAYIRENKKIIPAEDYDIYHYSYISADGRTEYSYMLFSSLDKNNFCVSDSGIFKKHKVLPYKNLEKIKGLISDEWNDKNFAYKKVFIVEKIEENQFKTIQVQLYFPFNSHGFKSRSVGSKEIIEIP